MPVPSIASSRSSKRGGSVQIAPVRVYVLPEQGNLFDARVDVRLRFGHDVFQRAGFFASANIGDDAIGAEVVAPDGYGQPRRPTVLAGGRQIVWKRFGGVEHFDLVPLAPDRALHELRKRAEVVRAEHHIEVREFTRELFTVSLPDATADCNDAPPDCRPLAQREVFQRSNLPHKAHVGSLANAAGHEHDHIGLFGGFYLKGAEALQHAGYALRIVLVHLAPERADAKRHI